MAIGEAIEITDAWVVIPPDRDRRVIVAAARALHRRAAEFAGWEDALGALGLVAEGRDADGIVDTVRFADGIAPGGEKLYRALAAGVDEDSMLVVWDTRGGRRDVYRVVFDGAGRFRVEFLLLAGGEGYGARPSRREQRSL